VPYDPELGHSSPRTVHVFDDAIASLLPLAPDSCATDPIAENHKHRACHQIEIVAQRCPLLAPHLQPIIERHSTPKPSSFATNTARVAINTRPTPDTNTLAPTPAPHYACADATVKRLRRQHAFASVNSRTPACPRRSQHAAPQRWRARVDANMKRVGRQPTRPFARVQPPLRQVAMDAWWSTRNAVTLTLQQRTFNKTSCVHEGLSLF
jgi:hypothetical protein